MVTSAATPPDDVTDADWVEQQESADPFEEPDEASSVRAERSSLEVDEGDLAEQEAIVPLGEEE